MPLLKNGFSKELRERVGERLRALPFARSVDRATRRWLGKRRTPSESPNLLPLLIQVLAAFSKSARGDVLEEEIDSSLGFLRYDYPEAVYSELRKLFRQALNEPQDLKAMAEKLATELTTERKIMLGVQLYDLIAKAGLDPQQVVAFYSFMTHLGMAAQAIDIVYQLNATDERDTNVFQHGQSPLESLTFGAQGTADVILKGLEGEERLVAFRYHDLILLKNQSQKGIVVRGRPLGPGSFCRIYTGHRLVLGEQVLTYQDLAYYFNAKKNVSLTHVYLTIDSGDEVQIDKVRTRESALEVRFGLKVAVRALRDVDALLNGVALRGGTQIEATLDDKIVFHNASELPLIDLRRRARALGGRFQLKTYKSGYLVSNNPSLLDQDDILLSPGTSGEVLLKILCDYENKIGKLEVVRADRPILVGDQPVKGSADLKDGDTIRIDAGQVLRCNFSDRIVEEERNVISTLEVRDLAHRFRKDQTALDNISFSVNRGEIVCVMGASGSGKSTLLRAMGGQMEPQQGGVLLNGQPLYANLDALKKFIAYIPQDDAFDNHLTVEENLEMAAAIRSPHLSGKDRSRRIEGRLIELGLIERRSTMVGNPVKKRLSGGERKRLNIGLDMISVADVFLFDEPTSGLSSKDSEHVIEIIRAMAHNKIVLVTIHQPNSKLFQMFSKALLLDKGGKLVFFGTPTEMLQYFAAAEHEQHFGTELGGCPACGTTRPEFIFDVLETPLRDLSGDVIYEENAQGQLVPARRFSADYWRDKYESVRLLQDVKQITVRKSTGSTLGTATSPSTLALPPTRRHEPIRVREEWTQFRTLWKRAFISKMRNRGNLVLTLAVPPLLGLVVSWALHFDEDAGGQYYFASAYHIPTYIFISLLVALFLALVNSVDDIIRDRVLLHRERNLSVRLPYYITAKFTTLALFSAIQCALFVIVGNHILEIRGMFWPYWWFTFVTALSGLSLGLLISSIVGDSKTAANFVPLVLIPQLIFGGALIKYEEMNKDLDVIYTFKRFFSTHRDIPDADRRNDAALRIPIISRLVATHYSYEALIVAQAKLNPLAARQDQLQEQIDATVRLLQGTKQRSAWLQEMRTAVSAHTGHPSGLISKLQGGIESIHALRKQPGHGPLSADDKQRLDDTTALLAVLGSEDTAKFNTWLQNAANEVVTLKQRSKDAAARLEDLKDTLAMLSGLESDSINGVERRLRRVDKVIDGGPLDAGGLRSKTTGLSPDRLVSAERLYSNQKVGDLVAKAETDQNDYRRGALLNVFFGPIKTHYFGPRRLAWIEANPIVLRVYARNTLVLVGSTLLCLGALYLILKQQLRTRSV